MVKVLHEEPAKIAGVSRACGLSLRACVNKKCWETNSISHPSVDQGTSLGLSGCVMRY